jgi:cytoskeletal protein RodZ
MRASLRLIFAVVLVCSGSAWPSSVRQEQEPPATSPEQNTQEQRQPSANPPAQPAPPAANNPAAPTTTTGEKASATPKPPVLKHRKRKAHHSSSAHRKTPASSNPDSSKVVVRNGGAKEGSAQLAPAVNPAQANKQRANTDNLLAATDANLKRIAGRQLTPAQQSMVDEINTYMRQAKAAASSADTNRAQTLAYKARLLSEELARK